LELRLDDARLPVPYVIDPIAQGTGRDRKSTRLNSSHLVISYAVFCLKKKKRTKRTGQSRSSPRRRRIGSRLRLMFDAPPAGQDLLAVHVLRHICLASFCTSNTVKSRS